MCIYNIYVYYCHVCMSLSVHSLLTVGQKMTNDTVTALCSFILYPI